eukprot:Pgem_evm1s17325
MSDVFNNSTVDFTARDTNEEVPPPVLDDDYNVHITMDPGHNLDDFIYSESDSEQLSFAGQMKELEYTDSDSSLNK